MNEQKKITIIIITISVLIVTSIITFFALRGLRIVRANVQFIFSDDNPFQEEIEVNSETFNPIKPIVFVDEVDMTDLLEIDDSHLDLTKLGTYNIVYYIIYKEQKYEDIKEITVVDKTNPEITLEGKNVTILIGEKYEEPGYKVTDNYDTNLEDKITIDNKVDNTKAGTYKITYKVTDSSGNSCEKSRDVIVKKPNVVVSTPPKEVKITPPKVVESSYSNTIKKNKFTNTNIHLEGYLKDPLEENKLIFVGDETKEIPIAVNNNNYSINIDPESIGNGTYKVFINEEKLLNKINVAERLSRAKVGSKLVTFTYSGEGEVTMSINNHEYLYDVLINPGHGSDDPGAVNEYIAEKEMNLTVSMYEKCRYEAHGLRVYMTRTNDNYGGNFGPDSLIRLHKLAYEMGYYGAVSKIVYSNHHNSIGNNYYSGYEVLIAGGLTGSEISSEVAIANKWNNIFTFNEEHLRFYARDYDTEKKYSKLNGETYSFKDNYAVNRIPYLTANVKSIIYEGCYMSNKNEFKWYWLDNNWYKVSEAKIETYVKSLGISYNSDNSSCL